MVAHFLRLVLANSGNTPPVVAVVRERDAGRCGSAPTRQRKFEILNLANPKFTSRRVVQAARGPVANPSDVRSARQRRARRVERVARRGTATP